MIINNIYIISIIILCIIIFHKYYILAMCNIDYNINYNFDIYNIYLFLMSKKF